ncbi:MAG: hypothetical protein U5K31_02080 [Balneolaceae bacterium]|nr:hypothetical protein [Balneolaceae bacterium]
MKVGIIGPAERAAAWEEHLRHHKSVGEVVITPLLKNAGEVDACLLLDESESQMERLLEAIKIGYHTFLISRLPTDTAAVEKVYHAAEEANVLLQFSHWPSIAPASQWMMQSIESPKFIQVIREMGHTQFMETETDPEFLWIDELAFCLKWIRGTVHHLDINEVNLGGEAQHAVQLSLRFDSGATSNIFITTCSSLPRHTRFASDFTCLAECDVDNQSVRLGKENEGGHLFFDKRSFDATRAAELSVSHFLKAIQLRRPTIYNGYDLMKLAKLVDRIRKRLR